MYVLFSCVGSWLWTHWIFSASCGIFSASCEGSLIVACERQSSWASAFALSGLSCSVAGRILVLDQ